MNKIGKLMICILMGMVVLSKLGAGEIKGLDTKHPVAAVNQGKYTCFTGKLVKSYWEYPMNGDDDIIWQSAIVNKKLTGKPVIFRFACGLGFRGGSAEHQLFINNSALVTFKTQYGDFIVKSANASFKFTALYIDGNDDIFGIIELKVAPQLIRFGLPQKFRMLGSKSKSKAWFMLSDTPLLSTAAALKLQADNKIKRRIEIAKTIRIKEQQQKTEALRPKVCYLPNNCQAAISMVKTADSLVGYDDAIKLKLKPAQTFAVFETAVDNALAKNKWLIIQRANSNSEKLAAQLNYLKQLDCVVWTAAPAKVAEYIRMRNQAKLIVEQQQVGHLTVTMHGFPSGFKATLPLTVQILLPDGAWGSRAVNRRKVEIDSQLIVIDKKQGLRFTMTPGSGMIDIYYNN